MTVHRSPLCWLRTTRSHVWPAEDYWLVFAWCLDSSLAEILWDFLKWFAAISFLALTIDIRAGISYCRCFVIASSFQVLLLFRVCIHSVTICCISSASTNYVWVSQWSSALQASAFLRKKLWASLFSSLNIGSSPKAAFDFPNRYWREMWEKILIMRHNIRQIANGHGLHHLGFNMPFLSQL